MGQSQIGLGLTPDQVSAIASQAAVSAAQAVGAAAGASAGSAAGAAAGANAVPAYATMSPKPEAGSPAAGTSPGITRPDHQHPRLTATARGTLDGSGLATVTFTQVFDAEPAISIISIGAKAAGMPVPDFDFTFTMGDAGTANAGKYVGGVVYGRRARKLPAQPLAATPIGVTGLLTSVISGLNTIALSITGYDTTEPAAGAGFSLIAVKQS